MQKYKAKFDDSNQLIHKLVLIIMPNEFDLCCDVMDNYDYEEKKDIFGKHLVYEITQQNFLDILHL
jgi:hypothetical protein